MRRDCARGEQVAFLGLLDTWPPETQNWQEKEANGLDPEVLAEINREREAFLAAQQGSTSTELFTTIEGNYADAVRLLTTAHSVPFDGKATLFVAAAHTSGRYESRTCLVAVDCGAGYLSSGLCACGYYLSRGVCKNWADYSQR
ncbi:thioesterase domain-containing protein [Escherichia coli]